MDLHQQFVEHGRNAREWMRKCAMLLPEINDKGIWRQHGFGSVHEYAAKLAGMSESQVDKALWTMNAVADKPELKKIVESKGINSVIPVVKLATEKTDRFWAEKAETMSISALTAYAKEYRRLTKRKKDPQSFDVETSVDKWEDESIVLPPKVSRKLSEISDDHIEAIMELISFREQALKPKPIKSNSRHIPEGMKRWVLEKYGNRCAFPRCNKEYEILHHVDRYALTGIHDPDKIVPLCKSHEQIAHLGLIENEKANPEDWSIRQNPNTNSPEYYIDKMVQLHRMAATRS